MKLINFGSLNIDYVYSVEHIVKPGETITTKGMNVFPGGKGLNQSVALKRAGAEVFHAGAVGKEDGIFLKELLSKEGVNTENILEMENEKTGHAVIQVDKEGQNSIFLYGGTNQKISEEFIDTVLSGFDKGDWILLQNEISELSYIIEKAHDKGIYIVINPSPVSRNLIDNGIKMADMLIMNEIEASIILEMDESAFSKNMVLSDIPSGFSDKELYITLGEKGSLYIGKNGILRQSAFKVKAVDTTAAGDTYTGYLIEELISGKSPEEAMKTASLASALACTVKGASVSIPYRKNIKE